MPVITEVNISKGAIASRAIDLADGTPAAASLAVHQGPKLTSASQQAAAHGVLLYNFHETLQMVLLMVKEQLLSPLRWAAEA